MSAAAATERVSAAATRHVVVDGVLTTLAQASVPADDLGLLRGDGVFEVFQLYAGAPFALDEHLDRLAASAAAIDLPYDAAALASEIDALLHVVGARDGNVRVLVTRSGRRVLIEEPPLERPARVRLWPVAHRVSPLLAGVKSLSYAANCHARRVAQAAGYDDALLFDDASGRVLECPFTSFAWVEDGRLWSPPLDGEILDSITRRVLFEAADVRERTVTVDQLIRAEGACVMGTGLEVVQVSEIGEACRFESDNAIVEQAKDAVARRVQDRLGAVRAEGAR